MKEQEEQRDQELQLQQDDDTEKGRCLVPSEPERHRQTLQSVNDQMKENIDMVQQWKHWRKNTSFSQKLFSYFNLAHF